MFRYYRICAVTVLLLLALPLRAQAPATPTDDATQGNSDPEVTVLVTAERTPQQVSESIASATVITAGELKKQGAQTASDALKLVPGVTVRQSGQPGSAAVVFMRGSKANQVLVLVDGKRMSSPAFIGGTDLSKFSVSNISRIEVIRGPASSLYGSEATGGVINIITKQPTAAETNATLGYGSYGRETRSLSMRDGSGNVKWQASLDAPSYLGTRPNSDYAATTIAGRVTFPTIAGWEVSLHGERYADKLGLPGADPFHTGYLDPDDRQWWHRAGVDLTGCRDMGAGRMEWRVYQFDQRLRNVAPGEWVTYDSTISGRTRAAEMTYSLDSGAHKLVFGGEYRHDGYDDVEEGWSSSHQTESVNNSALFAQDRWALNTRTDVVYGARYDDHSTAGSKLTPRVGVTHMVGPETRLRASYAEGFRAPNFVELYYPEGPWGPGYAGNPDLKPEKSKQYEIGLNTTRGRSTIDLALFRTNTTDLIQATSATPYENVGKAAQQGAELTIEHRLSRAARLSFWYSYVEAENSTTGERLNGIPHNQASLTAAYNTGGWDVALTGRWTSEIPDLAFDPVTYASSKVMLPGRAVFDLSFYSKTGRKIEPYVVFRNLTSARYELVAGYPAERFSIEAGVNACW